MARFEDTPAPRPDFRRSAPAATQEAPARRSQVRANKYGGRCADCEVYVPEGAGQIEKRDGKWVVLHVGDCPEGTPLYDGPAGYVERPATPPATSTPFSVPDGRYTVEWEDKYVTIRVVTQDEFDDFMPGVTLLKYLSGPNNSRDYTGFANVNERGEVRIWKKHQDNKRLTEAVKVLMGNPKAASQAYAMESKTCSRCGHDLTVPASLHAGLGPECAKKVMW